MNECLVTKLKGVVDNDNLPIYGTIRLKARTVTLGTMPAAQQGMTITSVGSNTISVTGSGYFATSFEGLSDPAQRKTSYEITSSMGQQSLFFANGDYEIRISNKYQLAKLGQQWYNNISDLAADHVVQVDLNELNYATGLFSLDFFRQGNTDIVGDLANLAHCTNINYIVMNGGGIYGDIAALKDMSALTRIDMSKADINIYGDISALGNKPDLTRIYLIDKEITGNLASLITDTSLQELMLNNNKVTGSIASLASMTTLTRINLQNNNITGDISSLVNLTSLTYLVVSNIISYAHPEKANNYVTGDFTVLGSIAGMLVLELYGQKAQNTIYGAIEDFIARQVSAGRTNYTDLQISDAHKYATFGGNSYPNQGAWGRLDWEGNTKYIYYTGGSTLQLATRILCKGASESDIAAWRAAGKEVTVIS